MNVFTGLFKSAGSKIDRDTSDLLATLAPLRTESPFSEQQAIVDLAIAVMEDAGRAFDATLGMRVGTPISSLVLKLFAQEPLCMSLDEEDGHQQSLASGLMYRNKLRRAIRMHEREEQTVTQWADAVANVLQEMYREFPEQAFVDPKDDGTFEEYSRLSPVAPLFTYVKDLPHLLHVVVQSFFSQELIDAELFEDLRDRLLVNIALASNIPVEERRSTGKRYVMPSEKRGLKDAELLYLYLEGTPFLDIFLTEIPIHIPEAVRFEHTYILAGTGHGKTQTLQFLIAGDLEAALRDRRSLVVMDSQGDLLQTLMRSEYLADPSLRDRFIYIDPTDMERPVGLNLFDVDLSGAGTDPVARETILNNTVELFDFFFGALLGADLTQKQGLIFRYLAVLMMRIPGANVHTLRELMEDGTKFRPYMRELHGSARVFFETRFFDRAFNETKKQVLNRLWGVLANQTLDRMMSAPKNTVDLFGKLQEGSIVFINTAKDFLGEEGCAIFSRLFVALLGQAFIRRAAIPKHERTPTYVYIDEAERVVDTTLNRMLAQIRKYKGALTFAHQNLEQLEPDIRAGVMTNTSIKLAGGVSAKDAHALAPEFRTSAELLLAQKRGKHETSFACYAKNVTDQAVTLSVPLGYLEARLTEGDSSARALIEASREKYGVVYVEPGIAEAAEQAQDSPSDWFVAAPAPVAKQPAGETAREPEPALDGAPSLPPPVSEVLGPPEGLVIHRAPPREAAYEPLQMGGGGVKHKYIENLIKELGEERGFRATVEETVHDGAGRVDVILRREEISLAFEISVTTTRDHELGNIEKCLALPFTHVVMISSNARHLKGLSGHIGKSLEEAEKKRVTFLLPEDLPGFLDGYPQVKAPKEKTVKGYTVRSRVTQADPTQAVARRRAIAAVVARSISDT